jgi:hypothetical protein
VGADAVPGGQCFPLLVIWQYWDILTVVYDAWFADMCIDLLPAESRF